MLVFVSQGLRTDRSCLTYGLHWSGVSVCRLWRVVRCVDLWKWVREKGPPVTSGKGFYCLVVFLGPDDHSCWKQEVGARFAAAWASGAGASCAVNYCARDHTVHRHLRALKWLQIPVVGCWRSWSTGLQGLLQHFHSWGRQNYPFHTAACSCEADLRVLLQRVLSPTWIVCEWAHLGDKWTKMQPPAPALLVFVQTVVPNSQHSLLRQCGTSWIALSFGHFFSFCFKY